MEALLQIAVRAVEHGLVPEALIRSAIRRLCRQRLNNFETQDPSATQAAFVESMRAGPIALVPEAANQQHYEVPSEYFAQVLGPRRKYSCCYWESDIESLAMAEDRALALTAEHARIEDGQEILELGCGWGSLTLWLAEHFPNARITALSNSHSQRQYIETQAQTRGFQNVLVITADINDFAPERHGIRQPFDRILSVEMFEHLRNYQLVLERIATWLKPDGLLFVHIFCHRCWTYPFDSEGAANWMGRYFFSGGLMPGVELLSQYNHDLQIVDHWTWNGAHYARTAEAWLANHQRQRAEIVKLFATVYGPRQAKRWFQRWRIFYLAVAELFGYADGKEWFVAHYLLSRR